MIERGSIFWSDLGEPVGSRPGKRRPVVIVSADSFNASRLSTAIAAVITSNTSLASMPGNVFLPADASGLPRDSVVNVTALVTLNRSDLDQLVGRIPLNALREIDRGLRLSLDL